jgi:hypothetical protein
MGRRQRSETTGDRRATGGADSRAAATADVVFDILAGATNRYILQYLIDCDREVSVNELVEHVEVRPDVGWASGFRDDDNPPPLDEPPECDLRCSFVVRAADVSEHLVLDEGTTGGRMQSTSGRGR